MFPGSTSAKLVPTWICSQRIPLLAKSSVLKLIGKGQKFTEIQVASIKSFTYLMSK